MKIIFLFFAVLFLAGGIIGGEGIRGTACLVIANCYAIAAGIIDALEKHWREE
jgi:hypothetical protein